VLDRIADHMTNRIDKLLPWSLAERQIKSASTQKVAWL
jgi:hypothetical protein